MSDRIAGLSPQQKRELLGRLLAERARSAKIFPLSFAQERLWFIEQFQPGLSVYNLPVVLRFPGPVKATDMAAALAELMRRHEILRTTFTTDGSRPVQRVALPGPVDLPVIDMTGLPPQIREAEVQRLASEDAQTAFDLENGPLIRARLIDISTDDHILLLTTHHIVSDGWSTGILIKEIGELLDAAAAGRPAALPDLPFQYADFAERQREQLSNGGIDKLLEYWRAQLHGAPAILELPTDRPRPPVQTFDGAVQAFRIGSDVTDGLRRITRDENASIFMVLLAAFSVLLSRYSGQDDIVVGTPTANRNDADVEKLIGFFVNTLLLRVNLDGNASFSELVRRVRDVALDAYAHQQLPFERLVEDLRPTRLLSHNPLFQVMLVLQNAPTLPILDDAPAEDNDDNPPVYLGTAKFDLTLVIAETASGLAGSFEYNTDLFDHSTITRMIRQFEKLLTSIVSDPHRPIAQLPLIPQQERRTQLEEWNATTASVPARRPHELFEQQVDGASENIAVLTAQAALTYGELESRANQLARHLESIGAGPGVVVGLCADRCLEMVVGIIGIAKAGATYLPLDPANPAQRLSFMIEDAHVPIVLTLDRLAERVPQAETVIIKLDSDWTVIEQHPDERQPVAGSPDDVLAIFYTSGSTGRPKGSLGLARGYTNLFWWYKDAAGIQAGSRVMLMTPTSFDASFKSIMTPLIAGGVVVLAPDFGSDLGKLLTAIEDLQPTACFLTPSMVYALVELTKPGDYKGLSSFDHIFVGGETTDLRRIRGWLTHPNRRCRISHIYGPSECSDVSTFHPADDDELATADTWPIGRPIANARLYVLDDALQLLPVGVPGELCISGIGVSAGYLGLPEQTADRFVDNPFVAGARLYRTGDRVRWLASGEVEFLGRLDEQVKIRGIRIEPAEIEFTLCVSDDVQAAVVITIGEARQDKFLVAYVVAAEGHTPTEDDLRARLSRTLPSYMVPSRFMFLDKLPHSANGKIDKAALPAASQIPRRSGSEGPTNPLERVLSAIWADVLHFDQIGRHDNFFDLGGHSLLATQVMSRVREALDIEVPLRWLFEAPTIAGLAAAVLADDDLRPKAQKATDLLMEIAAMNQAQVDARIAALTAPSKPNRT
jgi:amino acid adenylation domain-containing protein